MDEPEHDSQLLKGTLTLLILGLIRQGDTYGYQLVERIHALGLTMVPEGSVYPALGRLERDGHVTSYLVPSDAGPARKYYRLTVSGEAFLHQRRRAWDGLVAVVERLFAEDFAIEETPNATVSPPSPEVTPTVPSPARDAAPARRRLRPATG
jgi:PadR family transcriptional regulator, regulatory protein PadR